MTNSTRSRSAPRSLSKRKQFISNPLDIMLQREGYAPDLWGKSFWRFLHYASMVYKPKDKDLWYIFLTKIFHRQIPCITCRLHYCEVIKNHKHKLHKHLESRTNLVKFIVSLHNYVNMKVKKNYKPWDVNKFIRFYNK